MKAPVRIVLVEPREAGNVGAVARSMKNFGLSDLTIVGQVPALAPVAEWWASGAADLVQTSRRVTTLHEAIGDARLTIATTSSRGRVVTDDLSPRQVAGLYETLGPEDLLAIVFGREDRGLTHEEAMSCHRRAVIPTSPALPTMNLAQSVAIFSYELSLVSRVSERVTQPRADASMIERLHEHLQALLMEVGYLHQEDPDRMYDEIRMMIGRLDLGEREAEILLGMARQVEWRVRQS